MRLREQVIEAGCQPYVLLCMVAVLVAVLVVYDSKWVNLIETLNCKDMTTCYQLETCPQEFLSSS